MKKKMKALRKVARKHRGVRRRLIDEWTVLNTEMIAQTQTELIKIQAQGNREICCFKNRGNFGGNVDFNFGSFFPYLLRCH